MTLRTLAHSCWLARRKTTRIMYSLAFSSWLSVAHKSYLYKYLIWFLNSQVQPVKIPWESKHTHNRTHWHIWKAHYRTQTLNIIQCAVLDDMKKYTELNVPKERFEEEKCSEENLMRFVTVFFTSVAYCQRPTNWIYSCQKFQQTVRTVFFFWKIESLFNCMGIELKWHYFHCRL